MSGQDSGTNKSAALSHTNPLRRKAHKLFSCFIALLTTRPEQERKKCGQRLLTACRTVLHENLIVAYPVNKFSIAVFTTARHRFLSCARQIQSTTPYSASLWSVLILYSHVRLLFLSDALQTFHKIIVRVCHVRRYMTTQIVKSHFKYLSCRSYPKISHRRHVSIKIDGELNTVQAGSRA